MAASGIVISIRDGEVEDVYCDDGDTRVLVVEWNREPREPGDRGVAAAPVDGLRPLTVVEIDQLCELLNSAGDPCDCQLPGYFHSGVPGIIARMKDGMLATGAAVERCDLCRRIPTDEAARRRLVELGLA